MLSFCQPEIFRITSTIKHKYDISHANAIVYHCHGIEWSRIESNRMEMEWNVSAKATILAQMITFHLAR